jgi:thymidine kinase
MKSKLYFYYGAMGAAKTSQLLITNFNYLEKGMTTILITPEIDNRCEKGIIKSRIGMEAKADIVANNQKNLYKEVLIYKEVLNNLKYKTIDVIIVDEVQFLTVKQINQLSDIVDQLNITVLCFGLKTDFKNKLFPGSKRLIELADTIIELKTMCHCGKKATCNMRINNGKAIKNGSQIQVGGNESYVAVCRKCWKDGRIT